MEPIDYDPYKSSREESVFDTVDFRNIPLLSRRVGQRYGFAAVSLGGNSDVALLGGAVHFEFSSSQTAAASAKADVERGNPIPFSQVHCIDSQFGCSLLSIGSAKDLPCPRLYHSATRLGNEVVVFGGQAFSDKRKLSDVWILELEKTQTSSEISGQWKEVGPASRSTAFPPPRSKHAVTSFGNNGLIVSGGSGFEDSLLGDLWMAHIDTSNGVVWKKILSTAKVPTARKLHALSPMLTECEFLLHGGVDANGTQLSDLWLARINNDKCTWIELLAAPSPRSGGHVLIPAFSPAATSERNILVFGGNQPSAARYCLDTGLWTVCPFNEGIGHSFISAEMNVSYELSREDETVSVTVPSVLMVPDTVLRSGGSSPWIASIFPVNPHSSKKEESLDQSQVVQTMTSVDLAANAAQRKIEYRELCRQLPSIPPAGDDATMGALMNAEPSSIRDKIFVSQSCLAAVDYLVSGLVAAESRVSLSSWSSHVLGTGDTSSIDSLEALKSFINTEETMKMIGETANSCVVVVNTSNGERLIAFISESLNRHSLSSRHMSPVISITQTNYAQIQATLRLLMTYTPFRTPAALDELFSLFTKSGAGFLLIDFDAEISENKTPQLSHYKPVVAKDAAVFWSDVLASLPRSSRSRIEQYALGYLETAEVAVNGVFPPMSLKQAIHKTKLLTNMREISLNRFGTMLIGKLSKRDHQAGILLYSEGVLIRHVKGRFPFDDSQEQDDELESALNAVTGIVEVASVFTPVQGAFSDFHEALSNSSEWNQFMSLVQEQCYAYLTSS